MRKWRGDGRRDRGKRSRVNERKEREGDGAGKRKKKGSVSHAPHFYKLGL